MQLSGGVLAQHTQGTSCHLSAAETKQASKKRQRSDSGLLQDALEMKQLCTGIYTETWGPAGLQEAESYSNSFWGQSNNLFLLCLLFPPHPPPLLPSSSSTSPFSSSSLLTTPFLYDRAPRTDPCAPSSLPQSHQLQMTIGSNCQQ